MEREEQSQESTTEVTPGQTSTETQNQPQNPSPSIDTEGRSLYLSVLQEKNRELDNLRRQLTEKQNQPAPAPVITPEQEQKFFESPVSSTRSLVRDEVQQAIAPLVDFVRNFRQESQYDKVKNQLKNNPVVGTVIKENEAYVDQLMATGVEPTEANIMAAAFQAQGMRSAGLLGTNTPTPSFQNNPTPNPQPVPQNPNSNVTPPHLRPTAPAAPNLNPTPVKRTPTENERRLMREWGMSEEEYFAGQAEGSLIIEPPTTEKRKG